MVVMMRELTSKVRVLGCLTSHGPRIFILAPNDVVTAWGVTHGAEPSTTTLAFVHFSH
jgi:hypothetical protein